MTEELQLDELLRLDEQLEELLRLHEQLDELDDTERLLDELLDGDELDDELWLLERLLLLLLLLDSSSVRVAAGMSVVPELGSSSSNSDIPKNLLKNSWIVPARLFVTVIVQLSPTAGTFRPPKALTQGPPS